MPETTMNNLKRLTKKLENEEIVRKESEAHRITAEDLREEMESARQSAERARQEAEKARESAEVARGEVDKIRQSISKFLKALEGDINGD